MSFKNCIAVGYYAERVGAADSLVESWDGTAWSVMPSANPGDDNNILYGVSCINATQCVAVGAHGGSHSGKLKTLIESWDGTSWSAVRSPNPAGFSRQLLAVSCAGPTDCMAVGSYHIRDIPQDLNLAESWNGSTWSIVPTPNPGTLTNSLYGVSCVTASNCTAVGSYSSVNGESLTLVETWNGAAWSVASSPNPSTVQNLQAVSCANSTSCVAVGDYNYGSESNGGTLVETWNGVAWSVTPSPNPSTNTANYFNGVSCTLSTDCVAVGYSAGAFVESWNGSAWSVTPNPRPRNLSMFTAASCSTSTSCVAVGWRGGAPTGKPMKTFVEVGSSPK